MERGILSASCHPLSVRLFNHARGEIVHEMFVQYAPLFIMTLSKYVPIFFIGKR